MISYNNHQVITKPLPSHLHAITKPSPCHIDSGRVIDRLDNVFKCEVGDHVFVDWKRTGEWFYGDIVSLSLTEGESRLYDIGYDDGDVEYGVDRNRIQFLDRPPTLSKPDVFDKGSSKLV